METLPEEIISKIISYNSHPCADMIRKKRAIYSYSTDTIFENKLWAHWVLKFENEFGLIMVDDSDDESYDEQYGDPYESTDE